VRPGYRLVPSGPSADEYVALRQASGLTPRSVEQAGRAIAGSWAMCHVVHEPSAQAVAMGRLIGDGSWCFHVVDLAVLPPHRRQGLGSQLLEWLLDEIRTRALPGSYVSLVADPPAKGLYSRHGFVEELGGSTGMARWL
jgi:GNAT superfamily N-acetyltransferase